MSRLTEMMAQKAETALHSLPPEVRRDLDWDVVACIVTHGAFTSGLILSLPVPGSADRVMHLVPLPGDDPYAPQEAYTAAVEAAVENLQAEIAIRIPSPQ